MTTTKPTKWTTKDGREVVIAGMSDPHLRNAIRMMRRNGFIEDEKLRFYLCCTPPDSDGAHDAFMREFDDVVSKKPSAVLTALVEELKRRKLSEIPLSRSDYEDSWEEV